MIKSTIRKAVLTIVIILGLFVSHLLFYSSKLYAEETTEELRLKIDEKNSAIKKLEIEINQYKTELKKINTEKKSLQNDIRILDINNKKLAADISVTENKISQTSLKLQTLNWDIGDKKNKLTLHKSAVAQTIVYINELDNQSLLENILIDQSLSQAMDSIESAERFQISVKKQIQGLEEVKVSLENTRDETVKIMNEMTALKKELSNRKKIAEYNVKEKNNLLKVTKNSESNYNKLLNEKVELRAAFEKELLEFESQLQFTIDPKSIPEPVHGLLSWPVDEIFITQGFGDTAFSKSSASVIAAYGGNGHNGIDFRASIGTPIKAALGGEIIGTGDTDIVCAGASYGKWVLVMHTNGLSTLYAHLSVINVNQGDNVSTGDILGYSGNTGYSTGPHLHFTVYATQGMRIMERKSKVCNGTYRMPIANLKAYLNPLGYLPLLDAN